MPSEELTVQKSDGKLIFIDAGGYQTRNVSTIWCIQQADKIYNWKDFPKITIKTGDFISGDSEKLLRERIYGYSSASNNSYNNLIPDFNFHYWPQVGFDDYEKITHELAQIGTTECEIKKAGWVGCLQTSHKRVILHNIGQKNQNIMDIIGMNWTSASNNNQIQKSTIYISLHELIQKYALLIDVEGYGYSGRFKYLLWSRRPVIFVKRKFNEYWFKELKEWIHYIPCNEDLSNIVDIINWSLDNYDEAMQIAENAYEFAKIHLTRNASYIRWNEIITLL